MKKIVITGASCCGKTTVVNELSRLGYKIISEVARDVLKEMEGKSTEEKQLTILQRQLLEETYIDSLQDNSICFLDRGKIDNYAFCNYFGVTIPQEYTTQVDYSAVIILEPRPFENDGIRVEKDDLQRLEIANNIMTLYLHSGVPVFKVKLGSTGDQIKAILEISMSL